MVAGGKGWWQEARGGGKRQGAEAGVEAGGLCACICLTCSIGHTVHCCPTALKGSGSLSQNEPAGVMQVLPTG